MKPEIKWEDWVEVCQRLVALENRVKVLEARDKPIGQRYPVYPSPIWPDPYVGDYPPFFPVWSVDTRGIIVSGDIPGTVGNGSTNG